MNWVYKFERKHPRFGIPNLMIYVIIAMGFVFIADMIVPDVSFYQLLMFDRGMILQGQVWRLITFIFLPPNTSMVFIIFSLYFYYFAGSSLEMEWGVAGFTIYYIIGILGTIAAGFISGTATNIFLNLSLYFAFAIIYPDTQLYLFFFIPVKVKYLAFANALLYIVFFIIGDWGYRASLIASLINVIIFFGGTFIKNIKRNAQYQKTRRSFRQENRQSKDRFRDDNFK